MSTWKTFCTHLWACPPWWRTCWLFFVSRHTVWCSAPARYRRSCESGKNKCWLRENENDEKRFGRTTERKTDPPRISLEHPENNFVLVFCFHFPGKSICCRCCYLRCLQCNCFVCCFPKTPNPSLVRHKASSPWQRRLLSGTRCTQRLRNQL